MSMTNKQCNAAATLADGIPVPLGTGTASPSGLFTAELVEIDGHAPVDRRYLRVRISAASGHEPTFESGSTIAAWFPWRAAWDAEDRLWVDSSDDGVRVWVRHQGRWSESRWQAGGPQEPDPDRTAWDAELGADVFLLGIERPRVLRRH